MQSQRWAWTHRYAVPMFLTSLAAVVLASSGVVAVVVLSSGERAPGGDGEIDECVVGRWRTVSQTERLAPLPTTLSLEGDGPVFEYRADGTGVSDHGAGTVLSAGTVQVVTTGQVEFTYRAADGEFQYLGQDSPLRIEVTMDGAPLTSQEDTYARDPLAYECDGDTLRFRMEERNFDAELARLD